MIYTSLSQLSRLLPVCIFLVSSLVSAQSVESSRTLQQLANERLMLTSELDQFQNALEILHTDGSPPEQSPNSAVRTLAVGAATLKQQLVAVTEQEATLLQQQSSAAGTGAEAGKESNSSHDTSNNTSDDTTSFANVGASAAKAIESEHLRAPNVDNTAAQETGNEERLHKLLENYYAEPQESAPPLPTPEEIALRELARRDAETPNTIPFSSDKVQLSGAEGSTALAQISQRLMDPGIPESRRDIAPICSIKTRLLDTLVGVENRSLEPVGKNHYIVRVRLQPGDTTISILTDQWEVHLSQQASAQDFLITLYRPAAGTPELHVFAVDELLASDKPHIPAWLPDDVDIKTKAG